MSLIREEPMIRSSDVAVGDGVALESASCRRSTFISCSLSLRILVRVLTVSERE